MRFRPNSGQSWPNCHAKVVLNKEAWSFLGPHMSAKLRRSYKIETVQRKPANNLRKHDTVFRPLFLLRLGVDVVVAFKRGAIS